MSSQGPHLILQIVEEHKLLLYCIYLGMCLFPNRSRYIKLLSEETTFHDRLLYQLHEKERPQCLFIWYHPLEFWRLVIEYNPFVQKVEMIILFKILDHNELLFLLRWFIGSLYVLL